MSLGKTLYLKITMGNSKNEMGNCPFAPPLGCAIGIG